MTNADPLPATVLSRNAWCMCGSPPRPRCKSIARANAASTILSRTPAGGVFAMSRSLTTISADPPAEPWRALASRGLLPASAPVRLAPSCASTRPVFPRNGRDWHHLLELCGLVGARVIDPDGVYDPCRPNDRLLLGMKGSISEFELGVLRSRMLDAARSKARRGELRIPVPIGYVWHREIGLGFDPDLRVQEVTRGIFQRFRELGSARQVHLALKAEGVHFPRPSDGKRMTAFDWTPIRYRNVISLLKNPFHAGAYAYGKTVNRTEIVDGRARKTYGHHRPLQDCEILLKDHHQGYIDWDEFERNQKQLAANAYGRKDGAKSGRGGRALLGGLLACGRCARQMCVVYTGRSS